MKEGARMGINRIVNTDFWSDEKVLDNFTPEDKYFYLFLLSNPLSRQLGIYKLPIKMIEFYTGYKEECVKVLLKRFEQTYNIIKYNHETQEVAILNYLKWSIVRGGKPVEDCIKADMEKVKDKSLITFVYDHLLDNDINKTVTLENIFAYIEETYHNEEVPKKQKTEVEKHKYGEFKNVLLTEDEHEKLIAIENGERAIEHLSDYIKMKGYKAKSHYLAIKKWVLKAVEEEDLKAAEMQKRKDRLNGTPPPKKQSNTIDIIEKIYNEVG